MPQLTPYFYQSGVALIMGFSEFQGQEFNLSAIQEIEPKKLRVYQDKQGAVLDESGYWLVAEVRIPGKSWVSVPLLDGEGNPVLDAEGNHETTQELSPLREEGLAIELWQLRQEVVA